MRDGFDYPAILFVIYLQYLGYFLKHATALNGGCLLYWWWRCPCSTTLCWGWSPQPASLSYLACVPCGTWPRRCTVAAACRMTGTVSREVLRLHDHARCGSRLLHRRIRHGEVSYVTCRSFSGEFSVKTIPRHSKLKTRKAMPYGIFSYRIAIAFRWFDLASEPSSIKPLLGYSVTAKVYKITQR